METKERSHEKKSVIIKPDPTTSSKKWVKIDTTATIFYKKLPDDMILITGFENFMSIDDILDKYGRVVAITYNNYPSRMSGDVGGIILYGNNGKSSLRIGEVCRKDEFSKIISYVKKCGALLHEIIAAVNDGDVKEVRI
jgi:hypothetical protein